MRILMDGRTLGTKPSGVGMYGYNFAIGLLESPENIELYMVTDVAASSEILELERMGAQIISYGTKIAKSLALHRYFRFVQRIIHEVEPDIFWEINNLFPVKLVNPYGRIMTTVHDVFPYTMQEYFGRVYPYYFKYGIKNMLRYTDAIVFDSRETKEQLEYFEPSSSQKESMVLYVMMQGQNDKECRTTEESKPYYFYIGNLEKRKGSDILITGYEKYRALGGKSELYFGGKIREDDIRQMIEQIQEKKIGAHYIGYVTSEEKEAYFAGAEGFLFPSRAEGFGMPALEALEYDCPVLVSNLNIFEEILGDSVERFTLTENVDASAQALALKMMEMDTLGKSALQTRHAESGARILIRYGKDSLMPQLINFMKKIGE